MKKQKITRYFKRQEFKTDWSEMENIKEELILDWDEKDNFHGNFDNNKTMSSMLTASKRPLSSKIKTNAIKKRKVEVEIPQVTKVDNIKEDINLKLQQKDNYFELPRARVLIEQLDPNIIKNILDKRPKNTTETTFDNNNQKSQMLRKENVKESKVDVEKPEETKECPKCKKPYKIQSYYWHIHYCGKERTLECPHCPYKTKYNKCLVAHMSRIHPEGGDASASKTFNTYGIRKYCEKCNKAFEAVIRTSCEVCSSKLLYQCSVCNKNMSKRGPAYYHWTSRCGVKGYYHCYLCDVKTVFRSGVVEHLKKVHPNSQSSNETIQWKSLVEDGDSSIKCSKCAKSLSNFSKPKMHEKFCKGVKSGKNVISNSDVSGPTSCSTCGREFEHVHVLNRHVRSCKKNQYVASIAKDSDDVIIDVVGDDPPVPLTFADKIQIDINQGAVKYCVKCMVESKIEPILYKYGPKQNMQCSKCKTTLVLKCKNCLKEYQSKRRIVSHLRYECYSEDGFKCAECNFRAVSVRRVQDHYESVHKVLISECEKCGKIYKNPKHLKAHLTHCGLEPKFQCYHCPFKSKLKVHLKRHIFRGHMKELKDVD